MLTIRLPLYYPCVGMVHFSEIQHLVISDYQDTSASPSADARDILK